MIRHVVMIKLKADAADDAAQKIREHLLGLAEIEVVRDWEVGINIGESSKPFDLVVNSSFDSLADVAIFRDHPKHVEAKDFMKPFLETSGTVDYEF